MDDLIYFGLVALQSLITCVCLLTAFAYMTYSERRIMARMQWRLGPNRTGPFGLLQPLADGLKLLFKEQLIPDNARPFLFLFAPCISLVVALTTFAVIPVRTEPLEIAGYQIPFQVADINVAVLFVLGVSSLAVYGMVLGGWASGNKYSLIGGIRSSAQMISYELALGAALVAPLMIVGSLSFREIAIYQSENSWLVFAQPLAFIIFCIAAIAETNRAPFDLPEAEQELGAGFHTEYSGMRFALFFMAEYTAMITISAVATTVFLGGPFFPLFEGPSALVFLAKVACFMFGFIWLRATLPRFRYDQLMRIGWMVLLPLAFLNIAITAIGVVFRWGTLGYFAAVVGTLLFLYIVGKLNRRREAAHH